jgi:5-methylcytosine-specific restriction protein B
LDPSRIIFLQFHPAIGYDDFVEGFRPGATVEGLGVRYELAPRLFLKFAAKAAADRNRLYVVVIDELNRGDVARVFGELLTYIEPDYRDEEFTLPYSGDKVALPPNLILIATANPYDRSVTDLDDALLRRFWVIEMDPSAPALRKHLQDQEVENSLINRIVRAFEVVNEAMPSGFGHAAFLDVRTVDDLAMAWSARIRMSLKRALIHDRLAYDEVVARFEAMLRIEPDAEEPPA